jgi:hypothetical protein
MKKLIVLSVVFALVATAAFAVDLGGVVHAGAVNLFGGQSGDNANDDIGGSGLMKRIRIEGGDEAGEGAFGGYFRLNAEEGGDPAAFGNAWWKPIDQLKILIGSNGGDGFYGKEGVTGWMFYQAVSDSGGVVDPGNCWYSTFTGPIKFRSIFYGGDGGGDALRLEIRPIDMVGINLVLPYFDGGKVEDIFKNVTAQLDVNLDFGNIALTFDAAPDAGSIYLYYGGSFGDLAIDFGFAYHMDKDVKLPMGVGVGLKYATDAFGVKLRVGATLGGDDKLTTILADVMPFFSLGDNLTAFVSVGIAMSTPDSGDSGMGWHFNPYLQIGEDWGAKFLVGVRVWSDGGWNPGTPGAPLGDSKINWTVPIAIMVNF